MTIAAADRWQSDRIRTPSHGEMVRPRIQVSGACRVRFTGNQVHLESVDEHGCQTGLVTKYEAASGALV